jgi:acyl-CoA thioester hydrolase
MFTITVKPRFGDLDALGHINNNVPGIWFEHGRTSIIQMFDPDLKVDKKNFPLIVAHIDFDFVGQMYLKHEIEIKTWISKIGTKSFTVSHEAWQEGRLCVKGTAVIVHFDFNTQQTTALPEDKRKFLEEHLVTA